MFDLLDRLMKSSITYCTSTPPFGLPLSGTFHLFLVAATLSSYSFGTLMKSFLEDKPKLLSSCVSVSPGELQAGEVEQQTKDVFFPIFV